ncbi:sugar transferase [Flavobacterium xueshanense]|uniref:Sugar transferase involved in LPS biosynthesis (Colanic, teichoic acid) n=1 Tax=Flavobacterium xueshanense TaxID=935223 RepID=A0A1I2CKU9_9FLAO|nr:sugar transferase [Flavobacterium xueshanense]SFE68936.1 Sugar transferase involved in LPS biosynthesis (colanic, teichoic acid) [Flavobacterium xueshanense]
MIKRFFDLLFAIVGLCFMGWVIILVWFVVVIDTKSNGFFFQKRIGQFGKPFYIIKLKSVREYDNDVKKISLFGNFIRKIKIDEWPQLINILIGNMSMVGPRPDIPGYYDQLQGESRKILELKPGLTSAASLKYFNEEQLLAQQQDPLTYNDTVIFPDKVKMNLEYFYCNNLFIDIKIIIKTILR